jgi:transposase InsO family protein
MFTVEALAMAITHRNPLPGVIFHSDRGSQYTSDEFRGFCRANDVRPSVGRTGICYDNAVAESFFATIKKELIHVRPWPTIDKLRTAVFEYIESYYNRRRRHSTIGYDTPTEYELKYALTRLQAA